MSNTAAVTQRRVGRWFFIGVALSLILFNIVAFAPSLVEPSGRNVPLPLTPLVAAHAIVSAAFLLLFFAQVTLVATGRTDLHRRLGIAGAVLGLVFVVLLYLTMVENARRGFELSGDVGSLPLPPGVTPAAGIMALIVLLLTFGVLLGAGLHYRNRPDVHKRLMLLAVLGGLSATPVAHVTGNWAALLPWANIIAPVSAAVFLSLSAVHDRLVSGRIHPVSLWVALLVLVLQSVFFVVIMPTATWNSVANWLIR